MGKMSKKNPGNLSDKYAVLHKLTGNKKIQKSACKGFLEVVVYISLLKNSGAATKDFRADLPQKGCTELRASEKRSD